MLVRQVAARRVHREGADTKRTTDVIRALQGALAACVAASSIVAGQSADTTREETAQKTFFTPRDGVVAAGFLAASAGLSVFDARIAHFFNDTSLAHVREGQRLDDAFTHINETTLTVGGLAVYAIAKLTKHRTTADVAFHTAEAVAAASLASQVIRGPLGRTRPRDAARPYDDQYEFHFGQGFRHFQQRAFPSIHSSSGFAAASALVAEVKRRDPGATWFVAVPAYTLALTPGLARMYLGQHWASDILSGAFLGTFFGWRVVNYSHEHPTTRVDRIFLGSAEHLQVGVNSSAFSLSWRSTF